MFCLDLTLIIDLDWLLIFATPLIKLRFSLKSLPSDGSDGYWL
jgi:hypothetical protein